MFPRCPATPVPEGDLARLTGLRGVLDVVYNPERTGLCLCAERLGLPSESGLAMLVAQALYASELFQGRQIDDAVVPLIEREIRSQTQNVVLIGMPGAGKTSSGRALARALGRPFVDIDEVVATEQGRSAAQIIREDGEGRFREVESEATARYGARSGLVIACGGGVVTRPENYGPLRQNGTIVLLDRPVGQLGTEDRPVSQARGVEELAAERMPLYRAWSDVVVRCTGTPQGDAALIRSRLGL